MQPSQSPEKLKKYLNLDYTSRGDIWLTDESTLRKLVGLLGMGLPVLLVAFVYFDSTYFTPLPSISHYYYSRACSIFVIGMSLMAIFLLIYKGEAPVDFFVSSAAGIFALCVVLFPTSNITVTADMPKYLVVTVLRVCEFRQTFHLVSAGIFLLCLAYMSYFLFPQKNRNNKNMAIIKLKNGWIFKLCAIVMVVAILVIVAGFKCIINNQFYTAHHLTFWMETVAVESFGISWMLKGVTG